MMGASKGLARFSAVVVIDASLWEWKLVMKKVPWMLELNQMPSLRGFSS